MAEEDGWTPEKGDTFEHGDGRVEIVYAVAEGRVLTLTEYPSTERFAANVADAEYGGEHEGVRDLPPAAAFADDGPTAAEDTSGADDE